MRIFALVLALFLAGCPDEDLADAGTAQDAASPSPDAADAAIADVTDAGAPEDAARPDTAGEEDAAGPGDQGVDAGVDMRALHPAERIEIPDSEKARSPSVAVFSNGNAVAVWYGVDFDTGQGIDVWANLWTNGVGWGMPEVIDGLLEAPRAPFLYGDGGERAIAAWTQTVNLDLSSYVNIFHAMDGWGGAVPIYGLYQLPVSPRAVIAPSGEARYVFGDESGINVWDARHISGAWSEAQAIDLADVPVSQPVLTQDSAAWISEGTRLIEDGQMIDDTTDTFAALRGAGDELVYLERAAAADRLLDRSGARVRDAAANVIDADSLVFAVGAGGDAIAVWREGGEVWGAVRWSGGAWNPAEVIESGVITVPRALAIDGNGHAVLVTDGGTEVVYAYRFFGGDWGTRQVVSGRDMVGDQPHVALDAEGDGMIVWSEREPFAIIESVWSRRFE